MPHADIALETLSPAQLGAVNWATSMAYLTRAQADRGLSARIRVVEFESFLENPVDTLAELFLFLDRPTEREVVGRILQSGHMGRYAKDQRIGYTPELRAADLEQSLQVHRGDIDEAQAWLAGVIRREPGLAMLEGLINAG